MNLLSQRELSASSSSQHIMLTEFSISELSLKLVPGLASGVLVIVQERFSFTELVELENGGAHERCRKWT